MGTLGTLGALTSAAWYCASTTAAITAIKAAPHVVEVVTEGVEEIVHEVVEASNTFVRCTSWVIILFAVMSVIRMGVLAKNAILKYVK